MTSFCIHNIVLLLLFTLKFTSSFQYRLSSYSSPVYKQIYDKNTLQYKKNNVCNKSRLASSNPSEFEMQELRAQLKGMRKANVPSASLTPQKRNEIESYVRSVATNCDSVTPLTEMGKGDTMVGTWRLAFSTQDAALSALPKEANVFIKIYDPNGRGRLDYILKFTARVFALRSLTARSLFEISTTLPQPGLVSYQYQEITSDLFGLEIPTGLFGLLKGRVSYIETVYLDNMIWIDRGFSPDGKDYFNVFVKEEDEES